MTIKEVEDRTGLTRSNIRFYEKEKLIQPARNESNGYRQYTEKDVADIKKIAYLRTLGISIENIYRMIHRQVSLYEVLNDQMRGLDEQIVDLERARAMCRKMLEAGEVSYENLDVEVLYEAPLAMEKERLAHVVCKRLGIDCPEPDLEDWKAMVDAWKHPEKEVTIALVGKYIQLHDAYLSVVEALKHAGVANHAEVHIKWVDSELVSSYNVAEVLGDVDGILVPGGFGDRGIEGKITAIQYARENNVPFLGLCLGMQMAIVEFARHVLGYADAHSSELNPATTHPFIHIMPDQHGITDLGGTLRLGAYKCILDPNSKAYKLYGTREIDERHRHRYEVNNDYRQELVENGMSLCGVSPDGRIVEMIEQDSHPWFVATQAHPEFKSRPNKCHPLFRGFIEAALIKAQ